MAKNNNNVDVYISEIAERLWSGHASIMIGAGFSMNVQRSDIPLKKFPSWNDLGDVFYKKLYGKIPSDKDRGYLDALKLAEEVEASFGRSALNKIIREEVPDTEYQPSELHTRLLQLPWTDVFTTNYDTLLERTAERILEQRYETVINKEDLVWSTKPRIIKLHGSFPSERPFIITEEDYRKYPHEYAPFVNTVQQSLLENTLCLIGFSGNDPNFQKWIGWIRDNLGKNNSPKIFVVGKLSLSVGQKKLLQDRNIVPVDLSCYSNDHYGALMHFVKFLKEKGDSTRANLDFPNDEERIYFDIKQDIVPQFKKAISVWKKTRLSYPNWLILPQENRERLYYKLEISFIYHLKEIEAPLNIQFLYEFNWRIEKCLFPIVNDWTNYYEEVIGIYNPFPDLLSNDGATITPESNKDFHWNTLTIYWIELQLSLLRYYREENFTEKWLSLSETFKKIENKISLELLSKYKYEVCLYYMFQLDIPSVRNELNNWIINESLPYWEAKRAGLLAELGEREMAEKILETSLSEIRNRLKFSPVKDDYTFVSQEAYILQLSRYVRNSTSLSMAFNKEDDNYSERWTELIKYKCDPWGELKYFENTLKLESPLNKYIEKKYNFKIGSITRTHRLNKGGNYVTTSYAFLRYIEEIGFPFRLPHTTFGKEVAQKAISCISNYSPNWGFVSLIRTGDIKTLENVFNRKYLSFLNQQKCDELADTYLEVLNRLSSEIVKGDTNNKRNFAISIATVVPQILSRLCVKCSYEIKIKILEFLKRLYTYDVSIRNKYGEVDDLGKSLIDSFSDSEQYHLLPTLLDFPIIDNSELNNSFHDLIGFIRFKVLGAKNKIRIDSTKISNIISMLNKENYERNVAITRLVILWKNHLLNKIQENKFGKGLWKFVDDNGFPKVAAYYYYFAFLSLPHPKNINPNELLRKYFENARFPIEGKKEKGQGIGINNGNYELFHNIIGTSNSDINFQWTKEEINDLLSNIIEWWNSDKEYLLKTEDGFMGSIADEFHARFRNMTNIFSNIIVFNTKLIDPSLFSEIKKLLYELSNYSVPDLEAKVSFIEVFPQSKKNIFEDIKLQINSRDEHKILDALNAITLLVIIKVSDLEMLIKNISENIKIRRDVELDRFLECMTVIIKRAPKLITDDILNDLEIGLGFLLQELNIREQDSEKSVHYKLFLHSKASSLIVSIKELYRTVLKTSEPEYLMKWEENLINQDGFSEIRNTYLNYETSLACP